MCNCTAKLKYTVVSIHNNNFDERVIQYLEGCDDVLHSIVHVHHHRLVDVPKGG